MKPSDSEIAEFYLEQINHLRSYQTMSMYLYKLTDYQPHLDIANRFEAVIKTLEEFGRRDGVEL